MSTTMSVLLALGFLALVAAVWAYLRLRAPAEEEYHHFRCPGCKRRLRYRGRQVGHAGQCSNCGRNLVFPPAGKGTE